jgi:hypothetical protein
VTGYTGQDDPDLFPERLEFSLRHHIQTGFRSHPSGYSVGIVNFFLGLKRPNREADNLPVSDSEVNAWSFTYICCASCKHSSAEALNETFACHFVSLMRAKR